MRAIHQFHEPPRRTNRKAKATPILRSEPPDKFQVRITNRKSCEKHTGAFCSKRTIAHFTSTYFTKQLHTIHSLDIQLHKHNRHVIRNTLQVTYNLIYQHRKYEIKSSVIICNILNNNNSLPGIHKQKTE